jgi:hypothetical protein
MSDKPDPPSMAEVIKVAGGSEPTPGLPWYETMQREFLQRCDAAGSSRELSLAKTMMEQAAMWAERHFKSEAARCPP